MSVFTHTLELSPSGASIPSGSVDRAMSLMDVLKANVEPLSLSELSRRTGLAKSTTHRLVTKLSSWGVIARSDLGYSASMIPAAHDTAVSSLSLRRVLAPLVSELYVCTRRTVGLAVLAQDDVVFLERVHAPGSPWTPVDDYRRAPAVSTAAGKVLLAFGKPAPCGFGETERAGTTANLAATARSEFARIRHDRFCLNQSTSTPGLVCLAVPVLGPRQSPPAALVITSRADDLDIGRALQTLNAFSTKAGTLLARVVGS